MSCLYSAQGQLQCTETFGNCPDKKIKIGYDGRPNCGDVCTWYGYKKSCPMYAMEPELTKKDAICACSANYKNIKAIKDKDSYSSINGHGTRIIGGSRAQVFNNTSPNDCYWKNNDLKGNGYSTNEFVQGSPNVNETTPGICRVYFNG